MKTKIIVIISIAVVIALIFFLPLKGFRLFVSKTIDLENTMISVTDIKDIKELYVAKYYGEVVNSLTEETCRAEVEAILTLYKEIKEKPGLQEFSDSQLLEYFQERFSAKEEEKRVNIMLEAFLNVSSRNDGKNYGDFSALRSRDKNTFRIKLLKYIRETDPELYVEEYHEDLIYEARRALKIEDKIAYLARGKVLASIDLSALTAKNYKVDPGTGTLTIRTDLNVDCVINPLFVYGNYKGQNIEFKGYEVIANVKKAAKENIFRKTQIVKSGCRLKLIKYALEDDFIKKAKISAEQSLFNFLSLFKTFRYRENDTDKTFKEIQIEKVEVAFTSVSSGSETIDQWFKGNLNGLSYTPLGF